MTAPTLRHPNDLAHPAEILRCGGLVSFPTETVYGLGADARSDTAVAKVYAAKGRPSHNPLIAHVSGADIADTLASIDAQAARLVDYFWPGPLTLVLPARTGAVSALATAGLPTLAIRAPDHPLAQDLLRAFDGPLVAPSANRSGRLSPTTADAVRTELGDAVDFILDGGPCRVGVESTILKLVDREARLLRPGGVPLELLETVLGAPIAFSPEGKTVEAPGMLPSHYAPKARLRLNAQQAEEGEAWLGFGLDPANLPALHDNLSLSGDVEEAARRLFAALRALDAAGAERVAIAAIPEQGLGAAINDRLRRAAAPRPGEK